MAPPLLYAELLTNVKFALVQVKRCDEYIDIAPPLLNAELL